MNIKRILIIPLLFFSLYPVSGYTLTNGDFENSTNGWSFNQGTATATHYIFNVSGNNISRVAITTAGENIQLYQYGFTLTSSTLYRLRFSANSTMNNNLWVKVFKHSNSAVNYGLDQGNIDVTSTMTNYVLNFTASGFSGNTTDVRLQFLIGTYGASGEKYYFDNVSLEIAPYNPPAPTSLTATQGNFWINHTWTAGTGNTTDGYNVTVNGTWANGTAPFNNVTVNPHGWSNITVYSWNNSAYEGEMNTTGASRNTQLDNNPPVIGNISSTYIAAVGSLIQIIPSALDLDSDSLTFATDADHGNFHANNGSLFWVPQAGDEGTYNWHINVTDNYSSTDSFNFSVSVDSNTPGQPIDITATTGNFWVNTSWTMSVNTDSYNVSVNGIWTNGTTTPFNNTTVLPHGYSNITVYGYNLTSDSLGNGSSLNSQVPNNNPTLESMSISAASITTAQTLTIRAINASDLDGDNVTVINVSVLFNLGGTTNYSMSNVANTSNWTASYTSGTAGSYTITAFYLSDNYTASDVYIAAAQGFTVTNPTGTGSTGGSGSGGTTYINLTNVTNATLPSKYQPPPSINFKTITTDPTGIMVLWGLFIVCILWFIKKITQPNGSVSGLLLPGIGLILIGMILGLGN